MKSKGVYKMIRIVQILIMLLVSATIHADQSFQSLFNRANRIYEDGDFAEAGKLYKALIDQGCRCSHVYYNLGNSYLKTGNIGGAILNYRRALKLSPRDSDIRENLLLARRIVGGDVIRNDADWVDAVFSGLRRVVTITELSILFLFFFILSSAILSVSFWLGNRKNRRYANRLLLISGILTLILGGILIERIYDIEVREYAVAVAEETVARNGPGEHFNEVFKQQPGYEMLVIREKSGWAEIRLLNGYTGWVPETTIEKI